MPPRLAIRLPRAAALPAAAAALASAAAAVAAPAQDVLAPAGPQAAHIQSLWHLTLAICTAVMALVLAALLWVLWKRPRADARTAPDLAGAPGPARRARRSVVSAVAASALGLLFLIVASALTDRALARLSLEGALHIEVTANQWWWEARYDDEQPSRMFFTANELHIPVGRPVVLTLKSNDVIHSLWVPNLHGKRDLIPGHTTTLQWRADQPGTYRGQCAEFCGLQHSFMALQVVAQPPAQYEAWAQAQRQSAAEPAPGAVQRGRTVFLSTSCVLCHSIQGTTASARRAPDLTHLASRQTLAAGTLPNDEESLRRWIRDPQQFKPGVNMPATAMPEEDLRALVSYLRSLQ